MFGIGAVAGAASDGLSEQPDPPVQSIQIDDMNVLIARPIVLIPHAQGVLAARAQGACAVEGVRSHIGRAGSIVTAHADLAFAIQAIQCR